MKIDFPTINQVTLSDRRLFIGITHGVTLCKPAYPGLDRFKYISGNTFDMVVMFDAESLKFIYLNRGAVVSMDYSQQELLQMTSCDIMPIMLFSEFRQFIGPLPAGMQSVLHFETIRRCIDRADFQLEIILYSESESQWLQDAL